MVRPAPPAASAKPWNYALVRPARPVTAEPVEPVTLLPYGCTNLRITEFPLAAAARR